MLEKTFALIAGLTLLLSACGAQRGAAVPSAPDDGRLTSFATCTPANAALNRPASASSTENPDYLGAKLAFDGSGMGGTRWASARSDPQWVQVDLGSPRNICRVTLQWEAAYGKAFRVEVSNDGTTWSPVYSTTTGTGGTQTLNVSGAGRYVRMIGTARGTGYGYSLFEFQVSGTP